MGGVRGGGERDRQTEDGENRVREKSSRKGYFYLKFFREFLFSELFTKKYLNIFHKIILV